MPAVLDRLLDALGLRRKELLVTFDAAVYARVAARLNAAGVPHRDTITPTGRNTRRSGSFGALGERADLSTEFQIFVTPAHWPAARKALRVEE